jgi:hypothetical protein
MLTSATVAEVPCPIIACSCANSWNLVTEEAPYIGNLPVNPFLFILHRHTLCIPWLPLERGQRDVPAPLSRPGNGCAPRRAAIS